MSLTKESLIQTICNANSLEKRQATQVIESLLEIIKKTLKDGEDVLISGFGKFCVKEKNERRGRNPATGEDLTLRRKRVVTFRCSPRLKSKLKAKK